MVIKTEIERESLAKLTTPVEGWIASKTEYYVLPRVRNVNLFFTRLKI